MAFWSQAKSEPRRAHRFLLNLPSLATDDNRLSYQQFLCRTVTKPSYTISETEHKFMGNTYYYPGAVTWNTVQANIVNAVDPDGNAILMSALYRSGYVDPKQAEVFFGGGSVDVPIRKSGPGTPNKVDALAALGEVLIRELDGEGRAIGKWELKNPFITNATFGDLDYSSEDLLNIEITFRYDYAVYYASSAPGVIDADPINMQVPAPSQG